MLKMFRYKFFLSNGAPCALVHYVHTITKNVSNIEFIFDKIQRGIENASDCDENLIKQEI